MTIPGDDAVRRQPTALPLNPMLGKAIAPLIMITVSDVCQHADSPKARATPRSFRDRTGETLCTATVTDANGNIPSNVGDDGHDRSRPWLSITVRDIGCAQGDEYHRRLKLQRHGAMAMFSVLLSEDVEVGREITINVTTTIGDETLRARAPYRHVRRG